MAPLAAIRGNSQVNEHLKRELCDLLLLSPPPLCLCDFLPQFSLEGRVKLIPTANTTAMSAQGSNNTLCLWSPKWFFQWEGRRGGRKIVGKRIKLSKKLPALRSGK